MLFVGLDIGVKKRENGFNYPVFWNNIEFKIFYSTGNTTGIL